MELHLIRRKHNIKRIAGISISTVQFNLLTLHSTKAGFPYLELIVPRIESPHNVPGGIMCVITKELDPLTIETYSISLKPYVLSKQNFVSIKRWQFLKL